MKRKYLSAVLAAVLAISSCSAAFALTTTYDVDANGSYEFVIRDKAGNSKTYTVQVSNIDRDDPTVDSVSGNPDNWTSGNVTLTVNANDVTSGLHAQAYSFDDGLSWQSESNKIFDRNQTVKIKVRDKAENEISHELTINKIDKTKPLITAVSGNTDTPTNKDVTLTITAIDEQSGLHAQCYSFDGGVNWQTENSQSFDRNQGVSIQVRDAVGNVSEIHTENITRIDKIKPTISSVMGNPTQYTKDNAVLTVYANDLGGSGLALDAYSFDGGVSWQSTNSQSFDSNQTVSIQVRDAAGNISATHSESIDKLDKNIPIVSSVTGNPTEWTAADVELSVNVSNIGISGLDPQAYSFDGGVSWQTENSHVFTENQSVSILVRTAVGNWSEPHIVEIQKIDKNPPVPPKHDPADIPPIINDTPHVEPDNKELAWASEPTHISTTAAAMSGIVKYQYMVVDVTPATDNKSPFALMFNLLSDGWIEHSSGDVVIENEGIYNVYIRAVNAVGNVSPASSYLVKNDFTIPSAVSTKTNDGKYEISAADNLSGVAKISCEHGEVAADVYICDTDGSTIHEYHISDNAGNELVFAPQSPSGDYDDGYSPYPDYKPKNPEPTPEPKPEVPVGGGDLDKSDNNDNSNISDEDSQSSTPDDSDTDNTDDKDNIGDDTEKPSFLKDLLAKLSSFFAGIGAFGSALFCLFWLVILVLICYLIKRYMEKKKETKERN